VLRSAGYGGGFAGLSAGLVHERDYTVIAKGFRNPHRVHISPDDTVYLTDVGSDRERLYSWSLNEYTANATVFNGGWPCIETAPLLNASVAAGAKRWLASNNRTEVCKVSATALTLYLQKCTDCSTACDICVLCLYGIHGVHIPVCLNT
jgi:hypothetical protein